MFTLNQIFIVPDDKFFLLNICDDVYLRYQDRLYME